MGFHGVSASAWKFIVFGKCLWVAHEIFTPVAVLSFTGLAANAVRLKLPTIWSKCKRVGLARTQKVTTHQFPLKSEYRKLRSIPTLGIKQTGLWLERQPRWGYSCALHKNCFRRIVGIGIPLSLLSGRILWDGFQNVTSFSKNVDNNPFSLILVRLRMLRLAQAQHFRRPKRVNRSAILSSSCTIEHRSPPKYLNFHQAPWILRS